MPGKFMGADEINEPPFDEASDAASDGRFSKKKVVRLMIKSNLQTAQRKKLQEDCCVLQKKKDNLKERTEYLKQARRNALKNIEENQKTIAEQETCNKQLKSESKTYRAALETEMAKNRPCSKRRHIPQELAAILAGVTPVTISRWDRSPADKRPSGYPTRDADLLEFELWGRTRGRTKPITIISSLQEYLMAKVEQAFRKENNPIYEQVKELIEQIRTRH
ncbi:MAG: hypothetical protein AB7F40_04995 [Victivallaceae bacterium]